MSREERQYMVCNRGFLLDATATEPVKASSGGGSPSGDFPPGRLLLAARRWAPVISRQETSDQSPLRNLKNMKFWEAFLVYKN